MPFIVRDVDKGWKHIRQSMRAIALSKSHVKVGFLGNDAEHEVEGGRITTVRLAMVHEFGCTISRGNGQIVIPERSFLRSTWDAKRNEYAEILRKWVPKIYEGKADVARVLGLLGMRMVSDVQASIRRGIPPPNAPATLRKKLKAGAWNKGSKGQPVPLIDTGQNLLNRITYRVVVFGGASK